MQHPMRRRHPSSRRDLQCDCFLFARVLCDVAQCAYGRGVGGDDETIFAALDIGFYCGVWESDVSEAGQEGHVSTQSHHQCC